MIRSAVVALVVASIGVGATAAAASRSVTTRQVGRLLGAKVLVVAFPNGLVRICGSQVSDLMFGPPACPYGPRAVGVQVDALKQQSSKPAERWGYLYLVGRYRTGTFWVTSQRNHAPQAPSHPFLDRPPCARPQGGWSLAPRTSAKENAIRAYKRRYPRDITSVAFFRHATIPTIASTHPQRTRAALARTWRKQLCVVRSRYSLAVIWHTRKRLVKLLGRGSKTARWGWMNGAGGISCNAKGQPTTPLDVLVETPALRTVLRRQPTGLVVLDATLHPLATGQVPHPGQQATVDVAVATLWKAPGLARTIDRPALRNPVDLEAWNRNLSATAARRGLNGRVVSQVLYGESVKVVAVRAGWAKVLVPDQPSPLDSRGYPGWLTLRQLKTGRLAGAQHLVLTAPQGEVTVGGRVLKVSYGTRLPLVRWSSGDFAYVRTPDGIGTVAGGDWQRPLPLSGASIVAGARRFLGLRYLWGGVSAWGFDCSGLVWDVFRVHGLTVRRDTGPQSNGGRRVAARFLRPGDLVFYGSPATHVAIFAGAGKMIESPDSAHSVRLVPLRPGFSALRRYTPR
jgi:gamma-D-glutamyl-L-lysine dipeptidyl-peptidase